MTMIPATRIVSPIPPEPERRLIAAILVRTYRDLQRPHTRDFHDARRYVASDNFAVDCATLGYDPDHARRALGVLS